MNMKKASKTDSCKKEYKNIIFLCLSVLAVLVVSWTFTGKWPWSDNVYDSYMLQAQSWLKGRLDLGQNYPYLELAIFPAPPDVDGIIPDYCKYYVSFPPFPSFLMLPFALIHWYTADGFIAAASAMAGVVYAYKIMRHYDINEERAMFFAMLLTLGSNWLFIAHNAWVWFIAQNLAFTFSLMALYYAAKGKLGLSLAVWAFSVGCRPLNVLYFPVLIYMFCTVYKAANPEDGITDIIRKNITALIPMLVIALTYMALNFARFGSPVEFGGRYLPEHLRTSTGQMNLSYIKDNIGGLFRLPKISFREAWEYQKFDGFCMFMVSPLFIVYIVRSVKAVIKKQINTVFAALVFAFVALELLALTTHHTMGGAQFGNRYTNDVLPLAFAGLAAALPKQDNADKASKILFFWGFTLNLIGTILFYV